MGQIGTVGKLMGGELLKLDGVGFSYPNSSSGLWDVSLNITKTSNIGIIGASGSGKSTLGKILAGINKPDSGSITGAPKVSLIFQNPLASFDPKWKIIDIIGEPLIIQGVDKAVIREKTVQLAKRLKLPENLLQRYPHELSGGQNQRAAIARALITDPDIIVADEPFSALDVVLQAEMIRVFRSLGDFARIFISHDLAVVSQVCDELLIIDGGRIVEYGGTKEILRNPQSDMGITLVRAFRGL